MRYKRNYFEAKATPYEDVSEVQSIDTALDKQWRYSPKFLHPKAETKVVLTGYRSRDYVLAENECGVIHIPMQTVWHHVWEKDNSGKYTMQLVDFSIHQKHCPHAGGCKMWLLAHGGKYKKYNKFNIYLNDKLLNTKIMIGRTMRTIRKSGWIKEDQQNDYSDIIIDGIFSDEELSETKSFGRSRCKGNRKGRSRQNVWTPFGCYPYGNLIYKNRAGKLFFFNHENANLVDMDLNVQELL